MTTTPAPTDTTGLLVHLTERSPEDRLAYLLEKYGEAHHAAYVEQTNSADARRDGIGALIHAELTKTRAELDALKTDLRISRSRCASAERIMAEDSRKLTEVRRLCDSTIWILNANDVRAVLDANPATTAEPADEPKADGCTCGSTGDRHKVSCEMPVGDDCPEGAGCEQHAFGHRRVKP